MSLTDQFLKLIKVDGPAAKDPGPYLAKVISCQDPQYMGNLQVELLKSTTSGNEPNTSGQLFTARYLSPFAGQTPVWSATKNDDYRAGQQSYGMWMVPPDPGTNVLVIFAESNPNQCYWLGCVWDQYQNFSVPGHASTSITTKGTPADFKGKKIPVAEYNKLNEKGIAQDPTKFLKPFQLRLLNTLLEQGLVTKEFIDEFRGISTASARRELPSSVFGISTPGPIDKTSGAPKGHIGDSDAPAYTFRSRLGGTTFVMDDGNDKLIRKTTASEGPPEYSNVAKNELEGLRELPHNELFRIRTRTGHQVLLHNTEDLIYIANSKGSAWVELTSDGKIDIYAKDSMSVHTEADFNLTADRNITMEAGANIAIKASGTYIDVEEPKIIKGRIQLESQKDTKMLVGQNLWVTTIGNTEYKTNGETKITSGGTSHIKSGGQHLETAPQIHMNGPAASASQIVTALNTHILPGIPTNNALGILSQRAPMHEPWKDHENLNPLAFKVGVTDRDNVITVKNDLEFVPTPDPFKKEETK